MTPASSPASREKPRSIRRARTSGCSAISRRMCDPAIGVDPTGYRSRRPMLPLRDNIPTAGRPIVTYGLIAANVIVYFFWQQGGLSLGDPSSAHYICQLQDWAAIPYEITHPGDQVLIA